MVDETAFPTSDPGVVKTTRRLLHHSGEAVEIPVAYITGASTGPTFVVMSGMHAGEYAGVLAAQQLIRDVSPTNLRGRLIVVPVISTRAFLMRSMQLSPMDQREAHFQRPGNPGGSHTGFLVDCLFSLVGEADYLIDMHAGEFAQALIGHADQQTVTSAFSSHPYLRVRGGVP